MALKVLIASANGYGNAGDDICAVVSEQIVEQASPNADIKVTAPPFDAELAAWADVLMLGGGGIIYDANLDNMENYLAYVDYGLKNGKKTVGLGLGEQGIVTEKGEARYKKAFNKMDLLTVRSAKDAARLAKFGVTTAKATQDLAFSFDFTKYRNQTHFNRMISSANIFKRKQKLGVVLSNQEHLVTDLKLAFSKQEKVNALNFKNSFERNIEKISKVYDVTIITQSRDDLEMAEAYATKHGCKVYSYKTADDLEELLSVYAKQDLILTQRFHGIVFSFMMDIPVIALGYHGQKQYKLLYDMGLERKLVMYHKPEVLDSVIEMLGKTTNELNNYIIHLTPSNYLYLKTTAMLNTKKLKATLSGKQSSYDFADRPWPQRYEIIAKYLPKNKKVVDVGAGEEYITEWIKPKEYYPMDIFPCTERTHVVDLDKKGLPKLEGKFDYILAQGVFEYLKDAEKIMDKLHNYSDRMVTTGYFRKEQMSLWKRNWDMKSFEKALKDAGWTIVSKEKVPKLSQFVYYCESSR